MESVTIINILSDAEVEEIQKQTQQKLLKSINNLLNEYGYKSAIMNENNFICLEKILKEDIYIYPSNRDLKAYELQFGNLEHENEFFNTNNIYNQYELGFFQVLSIIEKLIFE